MQCHDNRVVGRRISLVPRRSGAPPNLRRTSRGTEPADQSQEAKRRWVKATGLRTSNCIIDRRHGLTTVGGVSVFVQLFKIGKNSTRYQLSPTFDRRRTYGQIAFYRFYLDLKNGGKNHRKNSSVRYVGMTSFTYT